MTNSNQDTSDVDALLRKVYEELQAPNPAERQRILAQLPIQNRLGRHHHWRTWPVGWAAVAVAVATILLMWPWGRLDRQAAYGLELLPVRIAEVHSFRLRGRQLIPDPADRSKPATVLAVDFAVQRPGQFRHTFHGVSVNGDKQSIVHGYRVCNGEREMLVNESEKTAVSFPVTSLDAQLKAEMLGQGLSLVMILGPPDARFQRQGSEVLDGVACNIYEGHFDDVFVAKVWLNPATGWPVRVIHETAMDDGTRSETLVVDQIQVNTEFPDSLFQCACPEGFQKQVIETPKQDGKGESYNQSKSLTTEPTGSAKNGQVSLKTWHGFRISDQAAVIIWKRSAPGDDLSGSSAWLDSLTLSLSDPQQPRSLDHAWLFHSEEPDRWLWSLVVAKDRRSLERGVIRLELSDDRNRCFQTILALRFADKELADLIDAAAVATIGAGHQLKLKDLRETAKSLAE